MLQLPEESFLKNELSHCSNLKFVQNYIFWFLLNHHQKSWLNLLSGARCTDSVIKPVAAFITLHPKSASMWQLMGKQPLGH
jgi:hypothetical protein